MPDTDRDPALIDRVTTARAARDEARRASDVVMRDAIMAALAGKWTPDEVGKAADLTGNRIRQISRDAPSAGKMLIAPAPHAPAVVFIIEKRTHDRQRPALARTTLAAYEALAELARGFDLDIEREIIPAGGTSLDLNRDNLMVMFGPGSSPLIAMAISADRAIKWRKDGEDWYIVDSKTGTEYHSQFDRDTPPDLPWPRTCYAHLGRIRRPDGDGSWLCIAGAHAPGVAGATEYLCRNLETLWDDVQLDLWSTVVAVTAGQDGNVVDVSRVTPVYNHGRR